MDQRENDLRVVFMGSPRFAVPALEAVQRRYRVVGVVTQPDRPAGRGRTLTSPPVKEIALKNRLEVIQPTRLHAPEVFEQLIRWRPDLIIVAAFGQILRQSVLDLPRYGCVNVHASLLPRWRGAAPIQAAILAGDCETGVSIMLIDAGVDTGAALSQRAIQIGAKETAGELSERLSLLGAELLIETLPGYLGGKIMPEPQDDRLATYAPMLKKKDGELDFQQSAVEVERKVRAYQPWPGAFMLWQNQPLKVLRAQVIEAQPGGKIDPGQRVIHQGLPAVVTASGLLVLEEIQPAGKRPLEGKVFLQGARGWDK